MEKVIYNEIKWSVESMIGSEMPEQFNSFKIIGRKNGENSTIMSGYCSII